MAVFEQLRISLARPEMPPLLEAAGHTEKPRPRRDFLERAFGFRADFLHQGRKFSYLPAESEAGFASGFFGREISEDTHDGPDNQFVPVRLTHWDLAFFTVDLAAESQIAFMQHNGKVGSPRPILESFFESLIRKDEFRDWQPHVRYVTDPGDYWEVAERFLGKITKLSFTFIPPNALRADERVMDFIRDASANAQAQLVKHEYENRAGQLNPHGDLIEGSVRVATAGGGDAAIKVGKRIVYSSSSSKARTEVPADEVPEPDDLPGVRGLIRRLYEKIRA